MVAPQPPRRARRILLFALVWLLRPTAAAAYRPFVSTDAAVADLRELEVELGYFGLARDQDGHSAVVPQLVLNYGVFNDSELVGQCSVEEEAGAHLDVVDAQLNIKTVLREGVLQEQPGVSIALETGALLPSTEDGERRFGFESVAIVSAQLSPLTFHLNLGGGIDRPATNPMAVWGLITELSALPQLRLVGEVNGQTAEREAAQSSGLLGVIWQIPGTEIFPDVGARKGFARTVQDWAVTAGVTFSWRPFARARE